MRHGRYIYILGDVHGDFGALNDFINKEIRQNKTLRAIAPYWRADGGDLQTLILQCGDFAWFWPFNDRTGSIKNEVDFLHGRVPIYWVGGNHEDWDALDKLGPGISEVDKGVFYCPFGSTLEISPQVTALFAGGAESHADDRLWRILEMKRGAPKVWWEQEGVSNADLARLANVPRADWVVSHTCPASFDIAAQMRWNHHIGEPSQVKLEQVFVRYEPKRWFFGHFHHYMSGEADGCEWECLADLRASSKYHDRIYLEWND